ncbi:MAG: retroviral-like aspartic protease family protein, partial [Nitrososphaerales archaeon]
ANIKVINPANPSKNKELKLLVDTGAIYTIVPRKDLIEIGIEPRGKRSFKLADGRIIEREVGVVILEYEKYSAGATIVFGKEDDTPVLGVQALEGLGLEVDPLTKQLRPMVLLLL